EITGAVGVPPPADAPRESAQPIQQGTVESQLARARQNEQPRPPFNPKGVRPIVETTPAPTNLSTPPIAGDFFDPPAESPPVVASDDVAKPEVSPRNRPLSALTEDERKRMPAASDTDSPARGLLPTLVPPKGDKFEGIERGGFGDMGEAQYFPLSGDELKELVFDLMDKVHGEIQNDLRFSLALTYPCVRV